jgi:hypothetical protein
VVVAVVDAAALFAARVLFAFDALALRCAAVRAGFGDAGGVVFTVAAGGAAGSAAAGGAFGCATISSSPLVQ